jgi:hypothetical protein
LALWINYLNARLQLYRDLELMPLDARGVWIDEIRDCDCGLTGEKPAAPAGDKQQPPAGDKQQPPAGDRQELPPPRELPLFPGREDR